MLILEYLQLKFQYYLKKIVLFPSYITLTNRSQNVYYVLDDLTVGTSGSLSTKEIQADDTISGFPYGSYEMLWQPAGETLLEFTVEAPIIESKGWIYGTMLAKTPDEGTFPLEGVLIEVWNLSGELSLIHI